MDTQQKLRLVFVNEKAQTNTGVCVDWVPKEYHKSDIISFINKKFQISCDRIAINQRNNKLSLEYENDAKWITYVFSNDTPQIPSDQIMEVKHFSLPIHTEIPINLGEFKQDILNQLKKYYSIDEESETHLLAASYPETFGKLVPSSQKEHTYYLEKRSGPKGDILEILYDNTPLCGIPLKKLSNNVMRVLHTVKKIANENYKRRELVNCVEADCVLEIRVVRVLPKNEAPQVTSSCSVKFGTQFDPTLHKLQFNHETEQIHFRFLNNEKDLTNDQAWIFFPSLAVQKLSDIQVATVLNEDSSWLLFEDIYHEQSQYSLKEACSIFNSDFFCKFLIHDGEETATDYCNSTALDLFDDNIKPPSNTTIKKPYNKWSTVDICVTFSKNQKTEQDCFIMNNVTKSDIQTLIEKMPKSFAINKDWLENFIVTKFDGFCPKNAFVSIGNIIARTCYDFPDAHKWEERLEKGWDEEELENWLIKIENGAFQKHLATFRQNKMRVKVLAKKTNEKLEKDLKITDKNEREALLARIQQSLEYNEIDQWRFFRNDKPLPEIPICYDNESDKEYFEQSMDARVSPLYFNNRSKQETLCKKLEENYQKIPMGDNDPAFSFNWDKYVLKSGHSDPIREKPLLKFPKHQSPRYKPYFF